MKERYEERVSELEKEREKIIVEAQEAINRLREAGGAGPDKDALVAEVGTEMGCLCGFFNYICNHRTYLLCQRHGIGLT